MKPKIKTILRKPWHRPGDRWQWRGFAKLFTANRRPKWGADGFWWENNVSAWHESSTPSFESQRRNSLRRIVDRKKKKGSK